jgi:outer membrane protein assembly factor BamB
MDFEKTAINVKKTLMQGVCYAVYKGENRLYGVLAEGGCATFIVISLDKGKIVFSKDAPGATGSWGVAVASDDRVYFGTYINAGFYRFDPEKEKLEILYANMPNAKFIFSLDIDENNNIYGGTWPNCAVFKFNGDTDELAFYDENIVENENYVRMVLYDKKRSALYSTVSAHCHILEYKFGKNNHRDVLPEKYRKEAFARLMDIRDDILYVYMTKSLKILVIDLSTGKLLHEINPPDLRNEHLPVGIPIENIVTGGRNGGLVIDKDTLEPYNFIAGGDDIIMGIWPYSDGRRLLMSSFEGKIFLYEPASGRKERLDVEVPRKSIEIRQLHLDENGVMHSGGYLRGGNSFYYPETNENIQYDGIGQCEGITSSDGIIYYGKYPGAYIYAFDTTKPWDTPNNPRELFELKTPANQDRPFAMEVYDGKLYVGTIPNYGDVQGALTIYDIENGSHIIKKDFSDSRSIVSFEYKDGFLFGGTTVCGGLGSYTKHQSGTVFKMNAKTGKYLYEVMPVEGCKNAGGLYFADDGMLIGCADSTFFIMDPKDGSVKYTKLLTEFDRGKDYKWEVSFIKKGPKKLYYIVSANTLFSYDHENREFKQLEAEKVNLLEFDRQGRLYCQYEKNVRQIIRSKKPVQ